MSHNRPYNDTIKRLHGKCLRLSYNDKHWFFEDLLKKDNSVSTYHKKLQALVIKMFKVYTKSSPEIMHEVFLEQENYNLQNQTYFVIPQIKNVKYDLEGMGALGPKMWKSLPND